MGAGIKGELTYTRTTHNYQSEGQCVDFLLAWNIVSLSDVLNLTDNCFHHLYGHTSGNNDVYH